MMKHNPVFIITGLTQIALAILLVSNTHAGIAALMLQALGQAGLNLFLLMAIAFGMVMIIQPQYLLVLNSPTLFIFGCAVLYATLNKVWYIVPTYFMLWSIPLALYYYPKHLSFRVLGAFVLLIWLGMELNPQSSGLAIINNYMTLFPDYGSTQRHLLLITGILLIARDWDSVGKIILTMPFHFYTLTVAVAVALGLYSTPSPVVVPLALSAIIVAMFFQRRMHD